jgi:hypothetical protein
MCMCPHTTIWYYAMLTYTSFLILQYMWPHTTIYVSSYYYLCVLILLYGTMSCSPLQVSSYYNICDLILLYMCPHTTIYVSSYYYISRRARQLAQDPPAACLHCSRGARCLAPHFTCLTGTKVQILTPEELQSSRKRFKIRCASGKSASGRDEASNLRTCLISGAKSRS